MSSLSVISPPLNEGWCTDCGKKGEFASQHNFTTHTLCPGQGKENRKCNFQIFSERENDEQNFKAMSMGKFNGCAKVIGLGYTFKNFLWGKKYVFWWFFYIFHKNCIRTFLK